jgi:TPR repeat protein
MFSFKKLKINRLTKKLSAMQRSRVHNQPSDEILKKELEGYHFLAAMYASVEGKKKFPFAREAKLACFRAAAMLDDSKAQYILGKTLLDEAKLRAQWEANGLFASQSNLRTMTQLYEEAHAYLTAAEALQHVEAKRLRGLCYINGWGVAEDKKQGFELIVASIQQENSWDRVPQIFASMGLNKPEFFAELTQMRSKA